MNQHEKEHLARLLQGMAHGQIDDPPGAEPTGDDTWGPGREEPAGVPQQASSGRPATFDVQPASSAAKGQPGPAEQLRTRGPLLQRLSVKRTLIPVALTLAAICLFLGVLGQVAGPESPYIALREGWFCLPVLGAGLVLLALGIVLMLQVRSDLRRR